jgi:methyltransferase (TIGR00027 family)
MDTESVNREATRANQEIDMQALSSVSNTALFTLWARAIEAQSDDPILVDRAAVAIVEKLRPHLAATTNPFYQQLVANQLDPRLAAGLALRAQYYDNMARSFRQRFPRGMVINLGAGLDTRFERLDDGEVRMVDLDLAPMIHLKRQLITEHPRHELRSASVLDPDWMDLLDRYDDRRFLFLAEGLFMYLPPEEVKRLVIALADRFPGSELVAEVFNGLWMRPPWRGFVSRKLRRHLKFDSDVAFHFGLDSPKEMESWDPRIHFLSVWSFLDAPERKLGLLRWFRYIPLLRLTQYNVHYQLV